MDSSFVARVRAPRAKPTKLLKVNPLWAKPRWASRRSRDAAAETPRARRRGRGRDRDNEGQANISAQSPAPSANPRLPGAYEHQERSARAQAPPREGPQTVDCLERVTCPIRDSGRASAFTADPSFSRCTRAESGSRGATARSSSCRTVLARAGWASRRPESWAMRLREIELND